MKPLQGVLFAQMQSKILNLPSNQAQLCTGVCWIKQKAKLIKMTREGHGNVAGVDKLPQDSLGMQPALEIRDRNLKL